MSRLVKVKKRNIETFISRTKAVRNAIAAGAGGAAAGGAAGYALGKKKGEKKAVLEKKGGIPAAILGGLTGTIPPLGALYGFQLGLNRGKNKELSKAINKLSDKVPQEKKANVYLEKIASQLKEAGIGDVGKALIKTKLAPAIKNLTGATLSREYALARNAAGSKVAPKAFSHLQIKTHGDRMNRLARAMMPSGGMKGTEANRIYAVAMRAKRMGRI